MGFGRNKRRGPFCRLAGKVRKVALVLHPDKTRLIEFRADLASDEGGARGRNGRRRSTFWVHALFVEQTEEESSRSFAYGEEADAGDDGGDSMHCTGSARTRACRRCMAEAGHKRILSEYHPFPQTDAGWTLPAPRLRHGACSAASEPASPACWERFNRLTRKYVPPCRFDILTQRSASLRHDLGKSRMR